MTRTALLPMGPDPFLNAYWLRNYTQVWADEVDELRILMCGQGDAVIAGYMGELITHAPHAVIECYSSRLDHGEAIRRLVDSSDATHIMLCEDDAFVRHRGVVGERFRRVESGETDIVGCPRGSTTQKIIDAAAAKWGPVEATELDEVGHSLWPCFLFIGRSDLLRTDGCYSARNWSPGEIVQGLDYVVDEPSSGDTFVSASYQLRALGLRVGLESQFRIDGDRIEQWGHAPWFHVGSLSSGYGSHFLSGQSEADRRERLDRVKLEIEPDWYKRCSFWKRAWEHWDGALPEHHKAYGEALKQLMDDIGIKPGGLTRWNDGFRRLATWEQ